MARRPIAAPLLPASGITRSPHADVRSARELNIPLSPPLAATAAGVTARHATTYSQGTTPRTEARPLVRSPAPAALLAARENPTSNAAVAKRFRASAQNTSTRCVSRALSPHAARWCDSW